VQHAREQEQRSGDQAVADHLDHGSGHRDLPAGGAAGQQPGGAQRHQHVPNVVDRGIGDHPFQVVLGQRDQRAVQRRHDTDGQQDPGPIPPGLRQHRHGDPDESVGAHLQHHPGQHRRSDRGGIGVGRGQPGVERHRRGFDGQPDHDGGQHHPAGPLRSVQRACRTSSAMSKVCGSAETYRPMNPASMTNDPRKV